MIIMPNVDFTSVLVKSDENSLKQDFTNSLECKYICMIICLLEYTSLCQINLEFDYRFAMNLYSITLLLYSTFAFEERIYMSIY